MKQTAPKQTMPHVARGRRTTARFPLLFCLFAVAMTLPAGAAQALQPCAIEVVEKGTAWPVSLVELRTTHNVRFVTDNAGLIAFDLPELMGRPTWFEVTSPGYEVPKDRFGARGVRLVPEQGKTLRIEVARTSIAHRIGRLTGAGLFAESQKLGREKDWRESGVAGCDSVLTAMHGGRIFWAWGDTTLPDYWLGIFDSTSATTSLAPLPSLDPPLRLKFDYFRDPAGRPRGVAKMPGSGPTWLSGYISLPDKTGKPRLVATYSKIKPPLETYERGLCVWSDEKEEFERLRVLWTSSDPPARRGPSPEGHPAIWQDRDGKSWALFGNPLPVLRCPATFEAWQDPAQWEVLKPRATLTAADGGAIRPQSGSIAWNAHRGRWVAIFTQYGGRRSLLGDVWYAEAQSPLGPWGRPVKVLSHANYSFYNPRLHAELVPADSPVLLFEGTYSQTFADRPQVTPRYDYNQILYRLDLDDPALAAAR